jgi:16S rRNA processing protein RimM
MQKEPKYFGKISSTHGFKGHLVLNHQLKNNKELNSWSALMLELKSGSYIPFFIQEAKHLNEQEAIILLEEVESLEEAKKLVSCLAYIPPTVNSTGILENEWNNVIGYEVFAEGKSIGKISSIVDNQMQQLFEIVYADKIIHIPVQDSFIDKLDNKKKTLHVNLPEGYLEIFTQ